MGHHAFIHAVAAGLAALMLAGGAGTAGAQTVVTTYVTKVQEERETTRWTLTEWLRIKERMRMMDLWLAMFSDPQKDRFRPELVVSWSVTKGTAERELQNGTVSAAAQGAQGRAQLWLTNLISSTVGIRTLNIDLGIEGLNRNTMRSAFTAEGETEAATAPAALSLATGSSSPENRGFRHAWYAGSLRIFGKHVQDTSLVFKYGVYSSSSTEFSFAEDPQLATINGRMAGVDLQAYLFKWLGAESSMLIYGTKDDVKGTAFQRGGYYDYMGFFEVSLLRIMAGQYREDWRLSQDGADIKVTETGYIGGVKLQF
jgi:hypothetical protein